MISVVLLRDFYGYEVLDTNETGAVTFGKGSTRGQAKKETFLQSWRVYEFTSLPGEMRFSVYRKFFLPFQLDTASECCAETRAERVLRGCSAGVLCVPACVAVVRGRVRYSGAGLVNQFVGLTVVCVRFVWV